ncbi:MAG: hypothetical protein NT049_17240, partial [Planctomycetota bacterium]|nr:hypothetical protein [Planctomycetota bacterium]
MMNGVKALSLAGREFQEEPGGYGRSRATGCLPTRDEQSSDLVVFQCGVEGPWNERTAIRTNSIDKSRVGKQPVAR